MVFDYVRCLRQECLSTWHILTLRQTLLLPLNSFNDILLSLLIELMNGFMNALVFSITFPFLDVLRVFAGARFTHGHVILIDDRGSAWKNLTVGKVLFVVGERVRIFGLYHLLWLASSFFDLKVWRFLIKIVVEVIHYKHFFRILIRIR